MIQVFALSLSAKKLIAGIWGTGLFIAVVDPTVTGLAIAGAIGAIATAVQVYFSSRAAADERRAKATAESEERKAAAAERVTNATERRIILERTERTAHEIAANTVLTEQSATVLTKVNETTEVIAGHVNSAATAAAEERKAATAKAEAVRVAHDAETAMLRETVADLKAVALALASSRAVQDALAAAGVTRPTPAAPSEAEHLQAIEENTAATVSTLQGTASALKDTADAIKEKS